MENLKFLKGKYGLHKAPETESAAKRTEKRTGEKVPQAPEARIQNYLNRFKEIIDRKDPEKRERGMEALKHVLYDKFVIKPNEIPEGYFELQKRIAREQGHGDIEIDQETRRQLSEVIITDQKSSLDNWIDYLSSDDAIYPDWLKYYAFRGVLDMGEYDKEKKQFSKRSNTTTKPFPDINREALAYVLDAISQKYGKQHLNLLALNEEEKKNFEALLRGENFSKLYAWAIEKVIIAPTESLEKVAGKWVKYKQGSDHMPLVNSLQGHGTGWCTAGESTAKIQLQGGDFYVYYSLDRKGKPTIPRAAIRMSGNQIGEVRGIAPEQNLDPFIGEVVQAKLKEFPDGPKYEKKTQDMKMLTNIENKTKAKKSLTRDDLVFLYEMNGKIEGFGYQRDPRIQELRKQRNPEEDMLVIFECTREQIASTPKEINQNIKAYVGKLEPGIFDKIQEYNIEYIYTSFPEGKIRLENLKIGGKTAEILEQELRAKKINISGYAEDMMKGKDFTTLKNPEEITLVRLTVRDLGFEMGATTKEIYQKVEELGLELCPAEAGPNLRLKYTDQPLNEWFCIGMKQIADSGGDPYVFGLARGGDGLWLGGHWAGPADGWNPEGGFVFRK